VRKVPEPDELSSGATLSRVSQRSRRQRLAERLFGGVALVVVVAVVVGFGVYVVNADGAARISALFAGGLVLLGVWLLLWSYIRRPPPGQTDDFLDKFLAGAGQALLLGAVLSFGFGVVGEQLDAERAAVNRRRDLAGQLRSDAGGKSFAGIDLRGESFFGLNLTGFDLHRANLADADLTGANLSNAILVTADLSGAELSEANLSNANLSNANLSGADLSEADLSNANLVIADLSNAELSDADLSGTDLVIADLSNAELFNADLSGADLSGADLSGANLTDANLTNALYDRGTVWPDGFDIPSTADLVED